MVESAQFLTPGITRAEYELRRLVLASRMGPGGVAVVAANKTPIMVNDIPYPFRQDSGARLGGSVAGCPSSRSHHIE